MAAPAAPSHDRMIDRLVAGAATTEGLPADVAALTYLLAAELLELHQSTGISLDRWDTARTLVERLAGEPVTENGV